MQTVVGVFESSSEARDAREALLDAGFDSSQIQVQAQSETQSGDYASTSTSTPVKDEGFMAEIGNFFSNLFGGDDRDHAGHYSEAVRRGNTVVVVTADDQVMVETARATLATAGAVDIDKRTEGWRQEGYAGFDASARPFVSDEIQAERTRFQPSNVQRPAQDGTVVPIVREEIEVGKREVDLGSVRVFSRTEVRPVQEQVQLREEHADIERRAVDRPATEADLKAFDGTTIEVREMAERPVVSKTARVVEEVVIGTETTTRTETITDEVRNTVVDVDKSNAGMGTTDYTPAYRSHYQSNLSLMGGTYEEYEPAYQYGSTLRSDPRYSNRSWDDVEMDAQRDWSGRYPGSAWEKSKAAIKHGWESMTGQR